MLGGSRSAYLRNAIPSLRGRTARWFYAAVAVSGLLLTVLVIPPTARAAAAGPPVGAFAGSVMFFDTECPSGVSVGIAFDGQDLWFSCYQSSPDLFRADPHTGAVVAAYNISSGLGALAYDANDRTIWAGWGGNTERLGDVYGIHLDTDFHVTDAFPEFNTCPDECFSDIDVGLAFAGSDHSLFLGPDSSQTITHYTTAGAIIKDGHSANGQFPYVNSSCNNGGLAIGDQFLIEGADGCSHVYTVDRHQANTAVFDFSMIAPGDPSFQDEGLACDPHTFGSTGERVVWAKEAYPPNRAHAFVLPAGTCGVGGNPAPGGGQLPFSGPLPLLIAHGITGTADSEVDIERFARATVPGLQPDRTVRVKTAALGSVWDNATEIGTEAQDTIHRTGAPAVNVIAHSKGGLETRLAMSPFVTTVEPEGGDSADAAIYLSDGVTPTITVTDLAGKVDPKAVVQVDPNPAPGAGNATVSLTGLSGAARQIHVALDQPGSHAGSAVDAQWQQQILTYAHALQTILGP